MISDGFTCFISGFADGVDLLFAEIVAERIAQNPALRLIAAIPYRRRLDTLKKSEQTKALIDLCVEIYIAAAKYHPSVYAKRNRYMVERSDRACLTNGGGSIHMRDVSARRWQPGNVSPDAKLQFSGFERRKTFAVEMITPTRPSDIQRSFLNGADGGI